MNTVFLDKVRRTGTLIRLSLRGGEMDYTQGSLRRAVLLLAIPMMLEMAMESVFTVVDLYFVGHLEHSSQAIQTVGLTESVLTIVYSLAIGMSMAATAVVARRVGEKNPEAAAHAGAQAIVVAVAITIVLSTIGMIYAPGILSLMGGSDEVVILGTPFIRIMMGSSLVIMLLFLINGIFRGAGNAAIAMKSLWIANLCNIVLCPLLINGAGPIPALGLTGAAVATCIGRSVGVIYQVWHLVKGNARLKFRASHYLPDKKLVMSIIRISVPGIFQFIIASCSWIILAKLVADTGNEEGSAGYQTALRLMMFFMLPAWGLSNAASTLVGQNLGARQPARAEESVMRTMKYNVIFMACVTVVFFTVGHLFVAFFTNDAAVQVMGLKAMRIMSTGFVFYGIGMVLINSFNGAGDTWTPTWVNFFGFWLFQIPFAWTLAIGAGLGPTGVFVAIPVTETLITIVSFILFRKGRWKTIKV